jgi:hypothetical protein
MFATAMCNKKEKFRKLREIRSVPSVLRIRDVYPGSRIRIRPFFGIPDPGSGSDLFYPGSRIRILQIREGKN